MNVSHHCGSAAIAGALPLVFFASLSCTTPPEAFETALPLRDGWHIASAAETEAEGAAISTAGFDVAGWTATSVPATVMAALVASGEVEDPYFNRNLEKVSAERFQHPWWYRTELTVEAPRPASRLVFEGINFRADVWLNGRQIGSRDDLVGSFRMFELDVSEHLVAGVNALAVLVHPPQPGDLTIGFVDWNPTSPDRNMGLWRGVHLRQTGDVSVNDVFVRTEVDVESLASASVTIQATLRNHSDRPVTATVNAAAATLRRRTLGATCSNASIPWAVKLKGGPPSSWESQATVAGFV